MPEWRSFDDPPAILIEPVWRSLDDPLATPIEPVTELPGPGCTNPRCFLATYHQSLCIERKAEP